MEIRRFLLCTAFFVVAVISQCSEARHSMHSLHRRQAEDDINYDEEQPKEPAANILTTPNTYEVKAGENLVMECKVSPNGTVVNWYKNNELYFIASLKLKNNALRYSIIPNTHNLEIKDVVAEDEGIYRCEVISAKAISINHTVSVLVPPKITKARNSVHSLHRRQAEDDINYDEEQADEANDDDTQNDTDIRGRNEPPKKPAANILTTPNTYEVKAGEKLVMECKVSPDGTVVNWYKNNELYFMGSLKLRNSALRYSIVPNSHNLEIKDVVAEDKGIYRCEVISAKAISINHTVSVLVPPKITRFTASDNGSVVEGNNLLLTCDASGMPPPNIVWSRDDHGANYRLEEKDGEFTHNTVFLKNVKKEHSGKYYCYAFNTAGTSQSDLDVSVFGKPRVHVRKTAVNSAINVEAVLECSTHDDVNAHIRWYKDGKLIEDSSTKFVVSTDGPHSNLTVVPSADEDFGTFTCEAENMHGKHNRSIELAERPVLEDLSVEDSKLIFTVHSHQPLEAIEVQVMDINASEGENVWQQLPVSLPEGKNHKYEIKYNLEDKLEPAKYQALVKVKNSHGWSENTEPLLVEIEARPQYIQHASVFRGNNAHSMRSSSVILSTVLMYLLVRMF